MSPGSEGGFDVLHKACWKPGLDHLVDGKAAWGLGVDSDPEDAGMGTWVRMPAAEDAREARREISAALQEFGDRVWARWLLLHPQEGS